MREKTLSEPAAVIGVAWGMTSLAFLEVLIAPWRPRFFVYAALAILLPISLRACRFGALREIRLLVLGLAVFTGLALQVAAGGLVAGLCPAV